MRIETQYGNRIVCGHIFPNNEVKAGQRWQSSTGSVVLITEVKNGVVYYDSESLDKSYDKDCFSFQCRYCRIVE